MAVNVALYIHTNSTGALIQNCKLGLMIEQPCHLEYKPKKKIYCGYRITSNGAVLEVKLRISVQKSTMGRESSWYPLKHDKAEVAHSYTFFYSRQLFYKFCLYNESTRHGERMFKSHDFIPNFD